MAQLLVRGAVLRHSVLPQGPAPGSAACGAAPPHDIRAVLFDKDGTLSRSEPMLIALAQARVFHCRLLLRERCPDASAAMLDALGPHLEATYGLRGDGIDPAGPTAVASREHNLISTATALAQLGLGWPEALDLAEAVFQRTDRLHGAGGGHPPRATDGLHDLIHRLRGVGVACAVISNDERQGIETFLADQQLRGHFQALRSAGDHPRKPDPEAVLALCGELGVEPGRCALIGDANSDLVMAERAGVAVVLGYSAGWRRRPPLSTRFPQLGHWRELEVRSA